MGGWIQADRSSCAGRQRPTAAIPTSLYPELFNVAERPVVILDLGFRVVDANEAVRTELGLAPTDLDLASLDSLWDVDLAALGRDIDAQLATVGVIALAAAPAPTQPDLPPATLSLTSLVDEDGDHVGYTMTFVTEEDRRAKRRLSLDGEGFQLAFDQVAVGMLLSGMDGYVIKCNPAMVRLFDRSIEEIAETDIISMIHPDDRTRVIEQAIKLMTGELDTYSQETRLLAGDGSAVWVHETATCIRDGDGNPLHYMTQFVDIRDRKEAEEALEKSQATIRFLFDGVPVPLLQLDSSLCISAGNASLADLLGRDPVGVPIAEVVHADDMGRLVEEGAQIRADEDWIIDIRIRRGDGTIRLVRSHGRIHLDDQGQFESATASWHDITDAKQQEEHWRTRASTDSLTGLPNRAAFLERVAVGLDTATEPETVAVLFIDLDKFKPVNDVHGHEAGDQVLCQVARRLRSCVRATDMVARLGGDEFVILLDVTDGGIDPQVIGQRIVERLAHPFLTSFGALTIGVSVGLATGGRGGVPRDLVHEADLAAYQAKAAGGNQLAARHTDGHT